MGKNFNGDAIYNPSGRAGEYSYWACNFFVGCSNLCTYCYCKKGILKHTMGGNTPTLKRCFKNEQHALEVFEKEMQQNLPELQEHGLFFSFSTDPMLPETTSLTGGAIRICSWNNIPVKILTKSGVSSALCFNAFCEVAGIEKNLIAFGHTLTGHDELEPGASPNAERIEVMRKLHKAGFLTFASLEPIIDFNSSAEMLRQTHGICDLYKIGLLSGVKQKDLKWDCENFASYAINQAEEYDFKIYFKDSFLKAANINREDLPSCCVGRDYNLFNN